MKTISLILIALLSSWVIEAQIVSAEYFIDTDPGVGNGVALTVSGNTINQDLNVPTNGLSNGIHKLYIRVLSTTGEWSLYDQNVFYVNPNNTNTASIASAEYFIDSDPGVGNGMPLSVTGDVVDMDFNIPTSGLVDGVHKLYVRVINTDGTWSLYDNNLFYVNPNNTYITSIASAEYFIDTDPGVGNGTPLSVSGDVVDMDLNVPTAGLSDGVHKLYVRLINTDGTWSLYDNNVFYVNPNNTNTASIASAEYFIDADPGVGNGTPLTVTGDLIDMDLNIPTSGLSDGIHKLYVRFINTDGTWSLYDNNVFYVSENNTNNALITAAEYFFDIDPGPGNATTIDLADAEILNEDLVVDTPSDLPDGDHFLYIRVQNSDGTWSLYATSETLTTLSANDYNLNTFKYYPNPVKDVLHMDTNHQQIQDFIVIDLNGKVVFHKKNLLSSVDLSHLNSGTYLIYVTTETGRVSKKIIKK
ncbi:T9SS type A sorting domain-containing protein [Winogradskyella sp.]|uniref:T9SS type A sorting domain-containing protein n=3 Tax=Winogradskyella sp. TaxID=1883156 RepID=UPI0035146A3E